MRQKIVAGNWKMNKTLPEAISLFNEIAQLKQANKAKLIVAPPFVYLQKAIELSSNNSNYFVAAQNCSTEKSGAFTGEISAEMLKSIGATYVIVGHSERRQYFAENNLSIQKKINQCLQNNLAPIFCCGESMDERNSKKHFEVIEQQLSESIFNLSIEEITKMIIAYEPVWAIGTGLTATSAQAQEIHLFIRDCIAKKYSSTVAQQISILYGGSCNATNAKELFSQPDIDGGLIGGASLKANDFIQIANSF